MDSVVHATYIYVQWLFTIYKKPELTYHNFNHTCSMVMHAREMIQYYDLSDENSMIIQVAAWFHDTGYLISGPYEHERTGVEIMKGFFGGTDTNSFIVEQIADCIMATKMPTAPKNLLEEILCDADSYHLGTDQFFEADEAVKQEFKQANEVSDQVWNMMTLRFLEEHSFFTDYCKQRLNTGKEANIEMLRLRINL